MTLGVFVGIALLSGYVGGLYSQQIPTFEDSATRPFIIEQTSSKKIENSPDALFKRIHPLTVKIITSDKKGLISNGDILSYGAILTSDGWIVSTLTKDDSGQQLYAMKSDGSIVRITQRVEDPALPVQFLRMEGGGLTAVDFLNDDQSHEALSGYSFVPDSHLERLITVRRWYPSSKNTQAIIRSSDLLQKVYPFRHSIESNGAPIFSENGQLVGVIAQNGIIPSLYIQNGLKRLLQTGTIQRIHLGLPYIDISDGGRISSDKPISLVTKKGKVSVGDGDIITKINDEYVDENRSVSELIQQYTQDDHIVLTVISKKGEVRSIEPLLK